MPKTIDQMLAARACLLLFGFHRDQISPLFAPVAEQGDQLFGVIVLDGVAPLIEDPTRKQLAVATVVCGALDGAVDGTHEAPAMVTWHETTAAFDALDDASRERWRRQCYSREQFADMGRSLVGGGFLTEVELELRLEEVNAMLDGELTPVETPSGGHGHNKYAGALPHDVRGWKPED